VALEYLEVVQWQRMILLRRAAVEAAGRPVGECWWRGRHVVE
jgi:hypothetical protein